MRAQRSYRGLSQELASPWLRTWSKLAQMPDLAPRPRVGGGSFLAWEGQGLATKSSRHLADYFNKTLTGGLAQRPTLKNALEIRSPKPRTVLRPRACVVLFPGRRDYENLDWSFNLYMERCEVQGRLLDYHPVTLRSSLAPVLNNLSGLKPGKSAYLGLGTVTQVPYMPCPCFPSHFYTSKYTSIFTDERESTWTVSLSIP